MFLNLEIGCLVNCLEPTKNSEMTFAFFSFSWIHLNLLAWCDWWHGMKGLNVVNSSLLIKKGYITTKISLKGYAKSFSIWFNCKRIIYWVSTNLCNNQCFYYQQLECLDAALKKKRTCFSESKKSNVLSEQFTTLPFKNPISENLKIRFGNKFFSHLVLPTLLLLITISFVVYRII